MKGLLFDLETNWLEDKDSGSDGVHTVHCGVTYNLETEEILEYGPARLGELAVALGAAPLLAGHNVSRFDIPVVERLYRLPRPTAILDTLSASRLIYASNHESRGWAFRNSAGKSDKARDAKLPVKLVRSHSLEAWGWKLGLRKTVEGFDTAEAFKRFTPALLARCRQDVLLNARLLDYLLGTPADRGWAVCSLESILTESMYAYINGKQIRNGVGFDVEAGAELAATWLRRQGELKLELQKVFTPWYAPIGTGMVKRTKRSAVRRKGRAFPEERVAGAEHQNVELVTFNPGSRMQIADRLQKIYGWVPTEYTVDGRVQVDEEVLGGLTYPTAPLIAEYLMLEKRLGQLCEGKQSWSKACKDDGIIHSQVFESGTRTSRMTHRNGMAQVPKVRKSREGEILLREPGGWGFECRSLFRPTRHREGWVQVGVDASGLELRMLGHYMARWDEGAFAKTLLEGDPHAAWMAHTGILLRDDQKTFTYALLYGAGDEKLGTIVIESWRRAYKAGLIHDAPPTMREASQYGKIRRGRLLYGLPALDRVIEGCHAAHKRGWIRLIDGAVIGTASEHGALNDLLQGGGARVMKTAKVGFDRDQQFPGTFEYMLDVHDEWQLEADPVFAEGHGIRMVSAIQNAGRDLGLRLPLDGKYRVGKTWVETH